MRKRIPPAALPVAVFVVVGSLFALARGGLTLSGFLLSIAAAVVIVAAVTMTGRGPYI